MIDFKKLHSAMWRPWEQIVTHSGGTWESFGASVIRPSQPWRWLAATMRWLSLRCLCVASWSERRGLEEPDVRQLSVREVVDDFHRQARDFRAGSSSTGPADSRTTTPEEAGRE